MRYSLVIFRLILGRAVTSEQAHRNKLRFFCNRFQNFRNDLFAKIITLLAR